MLDKDNLDPLIDTSFNMRNQFVDKNTGELLPFRTPFNIDPDKGVLNQLDDECVLSDYVPIKDQIKMFTREDILKINALDSIEKELSDLDDEDLEDYITEDELETLTNLEGLDQPLFSDQELDQATAKATKATASETKRADDTKLTSGGSEASSNEKLLEAQS